MTEQTFTTTSDPKDFNVSQVEAYLATADEAEVTRVLGLETGEGGKDREGVKNAAEARTESLRVDPDGTGTTPGLDTSKADTFTEAADKATEPEGEAYQKGYFGHAPSRDGDNPVDLTLAGVTGQKDA